MSANTSTIDLIDDFIPVDDDHEPTTRSRRSSAIHIKVYRVGISCVLDAMDSAQKDCGKMLVEASTLEGLAPQQEPAGSKSRKKSKKKTTFSKMQSS